MSLSVRVLSCFGCVWHFATLRTARLLSMGLLRQEYWSRLPCPPPGHLPDPGIESTSFVSPTLAGRFFTTNATREAFIWASLTLKSAGALATGALSQTRYWLCTFEDELRSKLRALLTFSNTCLWKLELFAISCLEDALTLHCSSSWLVVKTESCLSSVFSLRNSCGRVLIAIG